LQEVDTWVKDLQKGSSQVFSEPQLAHIEVSTDDDGPRLGPSRAYTLSLNPQIVYARSDFLPTLVSSQIHAQLEFLAVGSWWVLRNNELRKIPSTREDVFNDDTLSVRDKRSLMKFLRFVLQDEDHSPIESIDSPETTLKQTLEGFKIPESLHSPILALALSTQPSTLTNSDHAIRRIRRHLQSVGYFGPGFGAVIAKYGGNSEIAQVACRAQAVGGGVYLLGSGIHNIDHVNQEEPEGSQQPPLRVTLTDGTIVRAHRVVGGIDDVPIPTPVPFSAEGEATMLQSISIISDPLSDLLSPTSDNGPVPAAAIILVERANGSGQPPIYLQVHSEDTGECPANQSVVYACMHSNSQENNAVLYDAVSELIGAVGQMNTKRNPKILWHLSYRTRLHSTEMALTSEPLYSNSNVGIVSRRFDLAVEDEITKPIRSLWDDIIGAEALNHPFLLFEERGQSLEDDND